MWLVTSVFIDGHHQETLIRSMVRSIRTVAPQETAVSLMHQFFS